MTERGGIDQAFRGVAGRESDPLLGMETVGGEAVHTAELVETMRPPAFGADLEDTLGSGMSLGLLGFFIPHAVDAMPRIH